MTLTLHINSTCICKPNFKSTKAGAENNSVFLGRIGGHSKAQLVSWGALLHGNPGPLDLGKMWDPYWGLVRCTRRIEPQCWRRDSENHSVLYPHSPSLAGGRGPLLTAKKMMEPIPAITCCHLLGSTWHRGKCSFGIRDLGFNPSFAAFWSYDLGHGLRFLWDSCRSPQGWCWSSRRVCCCYNDDVTWQACGAQHRPRTEGFHGHSLSSSQVLSQVLILIIFL